MLEDVLYLFAMMIMEFLSHSASFSEFSGLLFISCFCQLFVVCTLLMLEHLVGHEFARNGIILQSSDVMGCYQKLGNEPNECQKLSKLLSLFDRDMS
jgi:hypothetical protein